MVCPRCHGKSYTNPLATGLFGVALEASFFVFGWSAFAQHSWIPLVCFLLISIAGEYAILKWVPLVRARAGSLKVWQLAVIAVISVVLFFPVFWLFSAVAGEDWGARIAVIGMLVVFPVFCLRFISRWA